MQDVKPWGTFRNTWPLWAILAGCAIGIAFTWLRYAG